MPNRNIVEFPSGRSFIRPLKRCQTVAALVKRIASRDGHVPSARKRHRLEVTLDDLTGVSDETVDLLTSLAEERVLSPASAARLAMRHANEVGLPRLGSAGIPQALTYSHHLMLAGDLFRRFAFRIEERASGAWVACATLATLDLLSEICPMDGMPFCILPGLEGQRPPSIIVRMPRNWRIELASWAAGTDRAAERHVLVVGGLPESGRRRATIVAGVRDGLRRNGFRVQPRQSSSCAPETANERNRQAYRHLVLIEIAFPGLIRVLGD
ncbi:hypothetical protein ACQKQD_31575 [Methylobacterium sp. NPDC080182]|uniref:hypothetical protein n=1 Tax=Methylobacterium sp. NPDC080182 TaxID=3390590 RepID=UPI003D02DE88